MNSEVGIGIVGGLLIYLVIIVLLIAGMWKTFEKAGKPGWAAIVPIYNIIVMLEIINKPTWWIALFLVPFANIVVIILIYNGISKAFDKGIGFTIGLIFLGFIFWPILGFGDSKYVG